MNPLFDTNPQPPKDDDKSYVLPKQQKRTIQPPDTHAAQAYEDTTAAHTKKSDAKKEEGMDAAVELIRRKVDALYAKEPNAKEEIQEVAEEQPPRSKHQQFMYELSTSGKSLADIQTAWHNYYVALSDDEKHQVWQEFYQANERHPSPYTQFATKQKQQQQALSHAVSPATHGLPAADDAKAKVVMVEQTPPVLPHKDGRSRQLIKKQILDRVSANTRKKAKEHLRSAIFGVSFGLLVILVFLFGFFNDVVIAPFIQPSRHVSATPIILSSASVAPTDQNEVIIPKINVEIPIDFSLNTTDENTIENSLENGVVHYPSTVAPGQLGNAAFFGHSSNNIFNPGKYKFAFVLLHELVNGDIFYVTYNGKVYTYKVFQKEIVNPDQTWVLNAVAGKSATAALITCDPPGTSLHRLVVWGEQISPDPSGNTQGTPAVTTAAATQLPSNGPTLWSRFIHWLF
ncbi:MAG TPA: sortase [Candidatus Saccharimonadales bacterium]|jgi:sortase A|nr:sortase [Candidatus Saccharimonadales bacterium]